jgi:hypothetical protein
MPGYLCEIDSALRDGVGEAWAAARLGPDGQVREVEWQVTRRLAQTPWLKLSVNGERFGSFVSEPAAAYASLSWMVLPAERLPSGKKRLELTTAADTATWPPAPFRSEYQASSLVSLDAKWADLLAFARGAGDLHVVLRARRSQSPIGRYLLIGADFQAAQDNADAALAAIAAKAANYRSDCAYTSDLYPVVTVT